MRKNYDRILKMGVKVFYITDAPGKNKIESACS
jgi:hypothetical protein